MQKMMKKNLFFVSILFISNIFINAIDAKTIYTGDKLNALEVIEKLDVNDLKKGRHDFYLKTAASLNTLEYIYIPVIVFKGNEGKTFTLSSLIHGDELNGIEVIHSLMEDIDINHLNGNIIFLPLLNPDGLEKKSRYFSNQEGIGQGYDLNRLLPGKKTGNIAFIYLNSIWENVIKDNTDYAIDIHTQTTGMTFPLFIYADFRNNTAREMSQLIGADQLKIDKGILGSLETTYIEQNIPAITLEVGSPNVFQKDLINRAVAGIKNILISKNILSGSIKQPNVDTYIGNKFHNIRATKSGFVEFNLSLNDDIKKGDLIGVSYDVFGKEQERYASPNDGKILSLATSPFKESGEIIIKILLFSESADCKYGC